MRGDGFRWFRTLATPTRHDDGTVVWDGVSIDITELKATEQALRESEERYRRLIEAGPIALLTHREGRVVVRQRQGARAVRHAGIAEDLVGRALVSLVHPDDRAMAAGSCRAGSAAGGAGGPREIRILRLDGRVVDVEAVSVPVTGQTASRRSQVVLLDITERKRAEQRVRHLAHHDALTGLPNRALLLDRLRQALRQARRERKRLAVVMLDLDHFKAVNDSLGHPVGDRLLCAVAGAAARHDPRERHARPLRRRRIHSGADPAAASRAARRCWRTRSSRLSPSRSRSTIRKLRTTTSVGVAIYPEHGTEPEAADRTRRHRALSGQGCRPQSGRVFVDAMKDHRALPAPGGRTSPRRPAGGDGGMPEDPGDA